jgi:hypothetical protein
MGTYGTTDDGTSKPQLLNLRSTMLTSDINAGTLTVSATTDPVKSNLGTVGKSALSPKGMEAFNAFKDSHPGLEGNDVLSGMRAFATLEMVQDRLKAKGAKQQILTPDTKVELAQGQVMTYAEYLAMKK